MQGSGIEEWHSAMEYAATPSLTLPAEGEPLYEVIDHQLVELPPLAAYPTWLATTLLTSRALDISRRIRTIKNHIILI